MSLTETTSIYTALKRFLKSIYQICFLTPELSDALYESVTLDRTMMNLVLLLDHKFKIKTLRGSQTEISKRDTM